MHALRESDSWFVLLLLVVAPVSFVAIFAPVPLWALAIAVPVGVAAWARLRRSDLNGGPRRYLLAVLAVAIGAAAMVVGETGDAPGLVLMGLLLVAGAIAFGVRTVHYST